MLTYGEIQNCWWKYKTCTCSEILHRGQRVLLQVLYMYRHTVMQDMLKERANLLQHDRGRLLWPWPAYKACLSAYMARPLVLASFHWSLSSDELETPIKIRTPCS